MARRALDSKTPPVLTRRLLVTVNPLNRDDLEEAKDLAQSFRKAFHQLKGSKTSGVLIQEAGPQGSFQLEPSLPFYTYVVQFLRRSHGITQQLALTTLESSVETIFLDIFELEQALAEYTVLLENEHVAKSAEVQSLASEMMFIKNLASAIDPES